MPKVKMFNPKEIHSELINQSYWKDFINKDCD